ncbi:MAG: hypothetical protein WC544_03580 [Patescibacteria group bacterium]
MGAFLFFVFMGCLIVLAFIKFKEEFAGQYKSGLWFRRMTSFGQKFDPEDCTIEHLLHVIADTGKYSDKYVLALARLVPYPDIQHLEAIRMATSEHRPFLLPKMQAADIGKPIL